MGERNYAPRPLSPSREYPGYQFYALLRLEGHSAGECLRYAALTVQNWLCERIQRADGSVPEEIRCPAQASFMDVGMEALRSCKLPFSEIISLPEQLVWALTVREPAPEVAARSFVTQVGMRAVDAQEVEFGVRVEVADRDPTLPEQDTTYRPQFVRLLFETQGMTLRQVEPLAFRRHIEIRNRRDVARLKHLADDRANQLPLVAFTHAKRARMSPAELEQMVADFMKMPPLPGFGAQALQAPLPGFGSQALQAPPPGERPPEYEMPYDVAEFARHIYGFAQAYTVAPEAFGELRAKFNRAGLNEGDILLIEPRAFGGAVKALPYRAGLNADWYRGVTDELQSALTRYSKHKPFRFGDVLFVEDARQRVRELELAALRATIHRELDGEQQRMLDQLERERALSAEQARQIGELRAQMVDEYQRGAQSERRRAEDLEEAIDALKAENARLKSSNDTMRQAFAEFSAMKGIVERVQDIPTMPKINADVVAYFRRIFADRIDFTERGARTAADCEINPDVLWACLYSVATVLADLYRSAVPNVEKRFKEATGWELAATEGAMTRKMPEYMNLRKDRYDGREISVEPHIKFPKSARKTGAQYQRLHYAYDAATRRIVVGYVGDHLENYLSLSFH